MPSRLASRMKWCPLIFRHFRVSFPRDHVIQVSLNRPEKLNCIDKSTSHEIAQIWDRFEEDEDLWVGIITGVGRAFCTGADLQEWDEMNRAGVVNDMAPPGLAGLPRRRGKKPIIAAVNGLCMGGGLEMVANCDVVVALSTAVFSLPETQRGIAPVAGCLPRLARTIGLQRTMDLVLTGRRVDARTMQEWGLVTRVVEAKEFSGERSPGIDVDADAAASLGGDGGDAAVSDMEGGAVVTAAIRVAGEMCQASPDALVVGRMGVRLAWEDGSVEGAVQTLADEWYPGLVLGQNFAEGIRAFVEKRKPNWVNAKL